MAKAIQQETSEAYFRPKVNENREVVGNLPKTDLTAVGYTLRPPTMEDLEKIEMIVKNTESAIAQLKLIFGMLSGHSTETLNGLDATAREVMEQSLQLFRVFSTQE